MNFLEYKSSGYHIYKEFATVVQNILMQALDGVNFHVIRARAKNASSLEKKKGIDFIENLKEEFADLAGCRIIFYFNKDVDHFNNSGIIEQNFEVVGRKIHYQASPEDKRYTGFHKIVKLNQDRLKLPEYKKYEGLLCEIQIHTIIDHAFSETSHDILYKKPQLDNIRKERWEKLERTFHRFHDDYIKKAGYELQSIKDEFERIVAGQNVYSLSYPILKTKDINNNERYDHLRNLISYGMEVCEFVPDEIKEIINTSIDCAKATEIVPIVTHYAESRGRDFTDIALLCLQVIEYFRYGFLDFTLDKCLNFSCYPNEEINKASDRVLELISRYDLKLLEEYGLAPQLQIMKFLESLSEENFKKFYKPISELCKRMLSTEADHSDYGDYRKVIYTTGAINSHENLIKLRQRVISFLEKLYDHCTDPKVKIQSIIPALIASTRLPVSSPYNNQLLLDILRDCRRLVKFCLGKLKTERKDVLQNIEHDFCFLYHFSKDVASKNHETELLQEAKALVSELESFRSELNHNQEFVHFKTIFGYKSAFLPSWENYGRTWDIMQRSDYREKEIAGYLPQIDITNYKYWKSLIVECINSEPRSEAGDHFCNFLYNLSKIHPDFVLEILKENEEKLSHVSWMILLPIYESEERNKAESIIKGWIDNKKYLEQIILILTRSKELDKELIKSIFSAAASINNYDAIIAGLRDLSRSGPDKKSSAIELLKIALPILTETKNSEWTTGFSFNYQFFDNLEEDLADQVLENLLTVTRITDAMQYIIKPISDKYPVKVMEFFGKRITSNHSIPAQFFVISESLSKNPELVIKCVRKWYKPDDTGLFSFRGGKLVHLLFSEFNKELEEVLFKIIESKDIADIRFVNSILANYEGKNCVHNICKEIIKLLPENSPELQSVKTSLNGNIYSGWGDHAISDNKRNRLEEITRWKNDENVKVKSFAKDYISNLESEMKTHRRHEDGIIESLKSQHDNIE